MKLKNKKTGGLANIDELCVQTDAGFHDYSSLAELNEEREDYEEPKEDYIRVITSFIHYVEEADDSFYCDESVKKFVEKLKAWKRLKDKGFEFVSWTKVKDHSYYNFIAICKDGEVYEDLDLLFSQEDG